ncbi:MAG: tetratricopeptide repeat protein [Burkholderiales bacterium]|jgi:tetratricopeptide (TPR) repeat protein|nr:tetratricopeptide repeat protein [Burkholderiales bacterium]
MRISTLASLALLAAFGCTLATAQVAPPAASPATGRPLVPTAPPTDAEAIDALIQERRLDAALKRADEVIAKNPRNAQVRFQRAVILTDLDRAADAIAALEGLSQDYPELPEPYNNLAVLHAAAGRYELARSLLQRSLDVAPNYVTAYENLGDLYVSMAADAYDRGLKLAPNSAAMTNKLALVRDTGSKLRGAR